ncbi:hypothetical protein RDABS01_024283 [Bienertia sinuspersici]
MYQTARIFIRGSSYNFPIKHTGRYILRLYFLPFTSLNYNSSTAKFSVHCSRFVLLNNYTPTSDTVKEYSFNVLTIKLNIFLELALNSFAFLNALEVFSVPEDATLIEPRRAYKGLQIVGLETIFRVNMGGPTVYYKNDSLWRTWKSDNSYLEHDDNNINVQHKAGVKYKSGLATRLEAPIAVYGTCRRLNHDIVSSSTNTLYFTVFVDWWTVFQVLDLTFLANGSLRIPIYRDFVTPVITRNKLEVSIGSVVPDMINADAILNGLEIMKMSNENNLDIDVGATARAVSEVLGA